MDIHYPHPGLAIDHYELDIARNAPNFDLTKKALCPRGLQPLLAVNVVVEKIDKNRPVASGEPDRSAR
jgi:hypothetical protein